MLLKAKERGFEPEYRLMDSWYSGLENLKLIASFGWLFLTRLKSNRMVNPDGKGKGAISRVDIPKEGRVVHLRGLGFVKVFRTISRDGDAECWATNDLAMTEEKRGNREKPGGGDRGGSSRLEAVLRGGDGPGSESGGDPPASLALLEGFFEAGG